MGAGTTDPRLALALRIAQDAGRFAVARAGSSVVEWKGPGDRVTEVDRALQARILREIATRCPGDGVIAEEGDHGARLDREFVWVVDPLDGTNNYALGIPSYAVAIGVLRDGAPHLGVVHDPNTGLTCSALRGHGAFANERRLVLAARELSASSYVSVRVPLDPAFEPVTLAWLRRYKLRAFGSVALHLAYAALGAIDLVLDHRAAAWDVAAGAAVLLEAGGAITDPTGRPLFPASFERGAVPFLAGNVAAHAGAVAACRRVAPGTSGERRRVT
jgi:myo-inositol-1(or 4)-monophosphatase